MTKKQLVLVTLSIIVFYGCKKESVLKGKHDTVKNAITTP